MFSYGAGELPGRGVVHGKALGRLEDRIEVRALTTHRHREAVGVDHLADQAPKRRDASVETGMADFLARRKMQSLASKPNGIREANERCQLTPNGMG